MPDPKDAPSDVRALAEKVNDVLHDHYGEAGTATRDEADAALARIVAHAEQTEAERQLAKDIAGEYRKRWKASVAHAEALEAERDLYREAIESCRDGTGCAFCTSYLETRAALTGPGEPGQIPDAAGNTYFDTGTVPLAGPGEPERCPTCGSLEPRLMDSAWMYANDVTRCADPWHTAQPTPSEGNPR